MTHAGFWDPLISSWWRSWGILYKARCQVFSAPVTMALASQSVNPQWARTLPKSIPVGFRKVKIRSVPALWPHLKVLGGRSSPSLDSSHVHSLSITLPTPQLLNGGGASAFSLQVVSVPFKEAFVAPFKIIACGKSLHQQLRLAPLLVRPHSHSLPLVVFNTTGKALAFPTFNRPRALRISLPKREPATLASSSLVFKGKATNSLARALLLPVTRSPLPAHRFKVEQRHEFRNQLALSVAEVPPEKILIRYVVDRIPTSGVARFTPRDDGTLSWTWAEVKTNPDALPALKNSVVKPALAGAGWVVVGQRLDTRTPVMTLVKPTKTEG